MDLPLDYLPDAHRSALTRGNIRTDHELLFTPIQNLSKRCRLAPLEMGRLIENVLQAASNTDIASLGLQDTYRHCAITTGDSQLDRILGGGLQTSMLCEVTGESAAGKTQFALQMSLTVQLSQNEGGLEGSCCYLTTKSDLQTMRLLEIMETHPSTQSSTCTLDDIHTMKIPDVHRLIHVLNDTIPQLMERLKADHERKPVRLIVLDAITELFHQSGRTSSDTLKERSRSITEISTALHNLASRHSVAVLVLNEVIDSMNRASSDTPSSQGGEVTYQEQSALFKSAEGHPFKEAGLGLTWANQINTRIMFSRTHRRRHLAHDELNRSRKRVRHGETLDLPTALSSEANNELVLIRKLSVIFSSIVLPGSLDFIVTEAGICTLPGNNTPDNCFSQWEPALPILPPHVDQPHYNMTSSLSTLNGDILADGDGLASEIDLDDGTVEDEYDALWAADERFFSDLDYSTLDTVQTTSLPHTVQEPSSQPGEALLSLDSDILH
jgi:DNA repair protein RAD57